MEPTQINGTKKSVRKLPVFDNNYQLEKFLEQNFTESLKQMIRITITTMIKSEMEEFRKEFHHKFEDRLYFNGTYDRNMLSSYGPVDDIPVPRFREPVPGFKSKTINVFTTEQEKFTRLIGEMHVLGISQRKIKRLTEVCFGHRISVNRIGAIHKKLANKREYQINSQILDDDYRYLMLDGIWETTKGYGWEDNRSVILCVLGIRPDGSRRILGFKLARAENTENWKQLLSSVVDRGVKGKNLKLAVIDDTEGAREALGCFYDIPIQNCIVHKIRNVMRKTKHKNKKYVASDLKTIFASKTKEEAMDKTKAVVRKWYVAEPKAMESLRFHIEHCFVYFQFPEESWKKIRTTNILERELREVRRRLKVFDNTFHDELSANRYSNTIMSHLNNNYPYYELHNIT